MGIAVGGQAQQRVGETPAGEFAVQRRAAVLEEGVGELKSVELDVGVAVGEALDQRGYGLRGPRGGCRDSVADFEDVFPVFACEILVGRLGWGRAWWVSGQGWEEWTGVKWAGLDSPTTLSIGFACVRNMVGVDG